MAISAKSNRLGVLLLLCSAALAFAAAPAFATAQSLSFGVVPQQAQSRLVSAWAPLIAELASRSGVAIRFATAPDIVAFEARLYAGEYDLAYVNPLQFVRAEAAVGYRAMAKERGQSLRGVIVVAVDSPVAGLADLHNETIAFPSPDAFAATLVPRLTLAEMGIHARPAFLASHDAVYRSVASGAFVAGGGVPRTLEAMPPALRARLRVLDETRGFSPHLFVRHARLGDEVVSPVFDALIELAATQSGRRVLRGLGLKPLGAVAEGAYDEARRLNAAIMGAGP